MRYLLIVVGLPSIMLGALVIANGPANASPPGRLFVQVGAVFSAVGFATMDIVEVIKAKRFGPDAPHQP
jgi:hypothetical protein